MSPEHLLANAGWVRRLAGALCEPALADDVTQDALEAGLRHPPDAGRPIRPWLSRTVRNFVRMRTRADRRRGLREAATIVAAVASPEELVAQAEQHRQLVSAVLALSEPYRQTILLRYYDGRSSAEIARLHGVPAATVRWRLQHALRELAAQLGEPARPRRAIWLPLLQGGIAMKQVAKAAAVGALLFGLLFGVRWILPQRRPSTAANPRAREPARATPARRIQLPVGTSTADPDAPSGGFEGFVRSAQGGQPVAQATITLLHAGAAFETTSDIAGHFTMTPPEPGDYEVQQVVAAGYLPFQPEFGHSPVVLVARKGVRVSGLTLFLEPALEYLARVVATDGSPLPGASIRALEGTLVEGAVAADERGEARFHAAAWATLVATYAGFAPAQVVLDLPIQSNRSVRFVLAPRPAGQSAGKIAGLVVDEAGHPIEGARVTARREEPRAPTSVRASALSDLEGRFTLSGLEAGGYTVVAEARDLVPAQSEAQVGAEGLRLQLSRGGTIRGRVRDARTGAPVPAFTIEIARRTGPLARTDFRGLTVFDGTGDYALQGLAPGTYQVTALARGYAPAEPRQVTLADARASGRADFALPTGGRLTGRVVERATGKPLAGARVGSEGTVDLAGSALAMDDAALTDRDGNFVLEGLAPGLHTIVAGADGHHSRATSGVRVGAAGTAEPVTIELTPVAPGEDPHLEMVGIGVGISVVGDAAAITVVMPGGGAADAGLVVGDRIVSVDGEPVVGLGFEGAVERIRGVEGTSVRLLIVRAAGGDPIEVWVVRKSIST
jgi:RNA polymerase sigma factor (sigma-70 family)